MTATDKSNLPADTAPDAGGQRLAQGPFIHSMEQARTIYLVTMAAACGPLLAGMVLFGWRSLIIAGVCVASCGLIEHVYYRVTRIPALADRSHAFLTGLLLAVTLPPFVPWYVAFLASAFAIIIGKAVFGGVGHFIWQPALVGRLAVAVLFSVPLAQKDIPLLPPSMAKPVADFFSVEMNARDWPLLAQNRLFIGDIQNCKPTDNFREWRGRPAPMGADGFIVRTPRNTLAGLTNDQEPTYTAIAMPADDHWAAMNPALLNMPAINDLLYGAWPGAIGETCAVVILMAGLYLVYRNYVKWQLPAMFLLAAAAAAAIAPIYLVGPNQTVQTVWWPVAAEGLDTGFAYICFQVLSGEFLLAAFFLATEMTCRPVTTSGQVVFGLGCGAIAMLLRMYTNLPIPAYMAVLAMNTFTPIIDSMWRPRVRGMKRLAWLRGKG